MSMIFMFFTKLLVPVTLEARHNPMLEIPDPQVS
jgi:hypothetical protein